MFEHTLTGLTTQQVEENRRKFGSNVLTASVLSVPKLLLRQFTTNPLIIILSIATVVSFYFGERISAIYIFWMILLSALLGFWNEYSAEKVVQQLSKQISHKVTVLRNGKKQEISSTDLVTQDIVFVGPGDVIPADMDILEAKDLEINESVLTGESLPVYKTKEPLFMGTVVLGGWAKSMVVGVGKHTQYGKISQNVSFIKPETAFQIGLMKFSALLVKVIGILAVVMFVANLLLGKSPILSLMFALAIAVGLTPELLPVIVTISLSHGAGKLSKKHVVARQLVAIENLGNMDILCTDKTGTLTEGKVRLVKIIPHLSTETKLLELALLCNSAIVEHKIIGNPMDTAIWDYAQLKEITLSAEPKKIKDLPFDYEMKGSLAYVEHVDKANLLLIKGAPEEILARISHKDAPKLLNDFKDLSNQGYRVLGVAKKAVASLKPSQVSWDKATDMEFCGFLLFMDSAKKDAKAALARLTHMGVKVKVLTGDNEMITEKICTDVGLENTHVLSGHQMDDLDDTALIKLLDDGDIFARVSPVQKLRIINLLKQEGHVVGYLGDGVNDIPALHAADVGISVDTAVEVTKNSANIVLMRRGLDVIAEGVREGRVTFANTTKYILMGTSSNFGNMFSAAIASFFLPFLPMRPAQILLNNSLYDISQMALPSDTVDPESLLKPRHWDLKFIRNYMLFFGPISSLYDFLTFGMMLLLFKAHEGTFQTGWFIESLATQVLVVFVIRTARTPFYKSKPSLPLLLTCGAVVMTAIVIPFTSFGVSLGFTHLPILYYPFLIGIVVTYMFMVEYFKVKFFKKQQI